jgi:hypothetical protein
LRLREMRISTHRAITGRFRVKPADFSLLDE